MYRQGDVLLVPASIPRRAVVVPRRGDGYPHVKGIVLAAGEATGHHHVVTDPYARLFEVPGTGERFVRVSKRGAQLVHEEHDTIDLGQGELRIQRQREYEPPSEPSRGGTRSSTARPENWHRVYD